MNSEYQTPPPIQTLMYEKATGVRKSSTVAYGSSTIKINYLITRKVLSTESMKFMNFQ